ncbi:DUF1326 domain-containing protein [Aquibium carbonis]|uniref:DUF1326 domain-containing protein n=1 Tax=Aquibium carbonis TaxID=2495581 RepID=A0A429Z2B4_9HYPH|nr:DUF1326 domain-containing protein [Aquibium carbonis]RST87851.1 DUF1326 domain-containing protein [Aquibium carbonis]
MAMVSWTMKGEVFRSCSCAVFCPSVLSLGDYPATEGPCQSWAGFRVDSGHHGDVDLSGLKACLVMDIPGITSRGNWTTALFIDKRASIYASKALQRIFTGRAGGSSSLLSVLVGRFLGDAWAPIVCETRDKTRIFQIPDIIEGALTPIPGRDGEGETVITNAAYWLGSEITVAKAERSHLRAHGRDWTFAGRSAEICKLDWRGP